MCFEYNTAMKIITEHDKDFICDIQAPCFQNLTKQEVEIVQQSRTQVLFRKGENLIKQGTFSSSVLFIIQGVAKQYIEIADTKNYIVSFSKPGDFIGVSSIFSEAVFSYSSAAVTDCQAFVVEKNTLSRLVKKNGEFAHTMISNYCKQNSSLYTIVQNLLQKQMNGRLADTLLYLEDFKTYFPEIFQVLSRKDIADFTGITVESTVKLLKTFEKDHIIRLHEKNIEMLNVPLLQEISRRG